MICSSEEFTAYRATFARGARCYALRRPAIALASSDVKGNND